VTEIWVYEDAGHWQIQRRFGGPAANSRWYQFDSDDQALDCVRDLRAASRADDWQELPATPDASLLE